MTKKKILVLALTIAMVAILAVGGSLAYLTDTDAATNTFTVGNVKIDLIEQQTDGDGGLEDFEQGKVLKPGKSNDGNAVSKIVTVKNTGANDAWVWVELKIPEALVSKDFKATPHTDESKNALHWNSYGHFTTAYNAGGKYKSSAVNDGIIDSNDNVLVTDMVSVADGLWNDFVYVGEADGYVTVRATMAKPLPVGKISLPCLRQVYMDWRITTETRDKVEYYNLPDGTSVPVNDTDWEIIVNAYAIQADGIDTVGAAVAAYANNGK